MIVSNKVSSEEYREFEPSLPMSRDQKWAEWRHQLARLSSSEVLVRHATVSARDARKVLDLQVACPPISVRSLRDNASMISDQVVLLAEIDNAHVGFCVSLLRPDSSDPLFIQVVGVAPEAQQRGVALALLLAAVECHPPRDIALATQDNNVAALALIKRFAKVIGGTYQRIHLGTYRDGDLGIRRGIGYRAWIVRRQQPARD